MCPTLREVDRWGFTFRYQIPVGEVADGIAPTNRATPRQTL
jgi:hypothetical protein